MKKTIVLMVLFTCCMMIFASGGSESTSVDTSAYENVPTVLSDVPSDFRIESFWFDDAKLEKDYEVEGYGIINLKSFSFADQVNKFREKSGSSDVIESGNEADFALLKVDITNRSKYVMNYLEDVYVKVVYDDEYAFEGWFYQYNYDMSEDIMLNSADIFGIIPMYTGHYVFGCTIPNSVVESHSPLQIIIAFGDNEIVYNIR